ncbi:TRPA1 [Symbiodinium sp. CCMP2592]|nr:TRPA1 [Symbiodinium sp. CCMP2592]
MDSGCCCGWAKLLEQWGDSEPQEDHSPLSVNVSLLSGQELCKLVVDRTCTVELLKHRIQSETDIPQTRQHLLHAQSTAPLPETASLELLAEAAEGEKRVQLQLIQSNRRVNSDRPAPKEDGAVLRKAITSLDVDECLELLSLDELPGINDKDYNEWTVLHHAAWCGLKEVCECILERHDFREADAHDQSGLTALHCAASRGHLGAALVLVGSGAFTVVNSAYAQIDRNGGVGWSARDIAVRYGHMRIVSAIDEMNGDRSR